ncbi:shikimate dehydrogenase [Frondihabitans sp. 4ASC-45]|uniref:shikimate dehydrogenase n=1 Tax=Frondihabitans sp. 4ASC-45 TaxID=3111636 RepID=UPI003C198A42
MRRLAVLGSPIEHSLSPLLQSTAFARLGLDMDYGRAEVASGELEAFVGGLDESWLGLSLTMPLKREVIPLLDDASPLVQALGVANTVVLKHDQVRATLAGFNTDVDGITRAVGRATSARHESCTILGGGATALSALAAAAELGASRITLRLRDTSKADDARELAERLDLDLTVEPLTVDDAVRTLDFVISTLPGDVDKPRIAPASAESVLLDVAYDPWPSPLATSWQAAGAIAVSGLDMLVEQAIGQVRLFSGLRQDSPLPSEDDIRTAMRVSVGLPAEASA